MITPTTTQGWDDLYTDTVDTHLPHLRPQLERYLTDRNPEFVPMLHRELLIVAAAVFLDRAGVGV